MPVSKQTMQPHTLNHIHHISLTHGNTNIDRLCIHYSFFESKNAVTCTHTGHRDTVAGVLSEAAVCDNVNVNIQWTQHYVQNDNKRWLVEFYRAFSLTRAKKNGHQYKCYWTQYFAYTLQYKFQYSYITAASTLYVYIYIYISVTLSHMTGAKWKRYRGCLW